ncbi:ammonium transporter [Sphingosinicella rhizophila]|uniref:Ammonium transporter n=1 Tax=Sphingosinicella rhizophila TaxID=3050082 RepID=A0ABU3QAJ3_9SPHN|nr:ammonium transporter [Sphingosinicella sp. GR2756]MDT9600154.1 ammonium transporter [Sphingosinicella sp. GR2756]
MKEPIPALLWAGGLLTLALGASLARQQGLVDDDTVKRLVVGANGLLVAWLGNRMPKTITPSACARQITRVAGWSFVLSGLVYTGLWAFAPIPVAVVGGSGAVIAGIAVTIGYGLWLRAKANAA